MQPTVAAPPVPDAKKLRHFYMFDPASRARLRRTIAAALSAEPRPTQAALIESLSPWFVSLATIQLDQLRQQKGQSLISKRIAYGRIVDLDRLPVLHGEIRLLEAELSQPTTDADVARQSSVLAGTLLKELMRAEIIVLEEGGCLRFGPNWPPQ